MGEQKPGEANARQFAANIRKYYLYVALIGIAFGLILGIWVIFLQQRRGLSLTQVTAIDVVFWLTAAFSEIPTGIVADRFGRKTSLVIGICLICVGVFAWAVAPTLPLIMLAYVFQAVGFTFLSGAQDALLFESVKLAGREADYTHIAGRVGAIQIGATAVGSVASGLLAALDLGLPMLVSGLIFIVVFVVALTFKEPQQEAGGQARKSYGAILRDSFAIVRVRPTLRYAMIYLALVSVASLVMEVVFLQPQAILLGVPIAGVGVVVMMIQIVNLAGSNWSQRIKVYFGERRVLYTAPFLMIAGLTLLAAIQLLPALFFFAALGFLNAVLRPLVMTTIQNEISDDIRATILSLQSLLFTLILAVSEPVLGIVADQSGLPAAYIGLALGLGILILLLLWTSREHFPKIAVSTP